MGQNFVIKNNSDIREKQIIKKGRNKCIRS